MVPRLLDRPLFGRSEFWPRWDPPAIATEKASIARSRFELSCPSSPSSHGILPARANTSSSNATLALSNPGRLCLPRSSDGGAEFEELGLTIEMSTGPGPCLRAEADGRCEYGDDAVNEST